MGGNLLKTWNLPEKRLNNEDYYSLKDTLLKKFRKDSICDSFYGDVAPCIRNKESHGDLDIILAHPVDGHWLRYLSFSDYIQKEFGYKPFKNSNCYSFPVDGFQVDVTFVPLNEFRSSFSYSSWGDLGNIMGRVFHKMGLHYGHSGLSFWIRQGLFDNNLQWSDSDHIFEKVVLTQNMQWICEIGGFDYSRWKLGFDSEKDAFDFVIDSKYFNKELFALENLNSINRTRNRKRGMYMRFVEYVANCDKVGKPFLSKHEYSLIMQCKFENLRSAISKHRFTYEVAKTIKEKVNGKLVMEWCNLSEKDGAIIGKIMSHVRDTNEHILEMSQEEIKKLVVEYYMYNFKTI